MATRKKTASTTTEPKEKKPRGKRPLKSVSISDAADKLSAEHLEELDAFDVEDKGDTAEEDKPKKKKPRPPTPEEIAAAPPKTDEQFRLSLRRKVRMYYDIQEIRIQTLGRLTKKAPNATIMLHPADVAALWARLTDLELAEKNMLAQLVEHLEQVPFYKKVIEPERKGRFRGLGPRMGGVIVSSFDIKREETVSQMWAFAGLRPIPCKRCRHCFTAVSEVQSDSGQIELRHTSMASSKCAFKGLVLRPQDTRESAKAQRPVQGEKLPYNAWLRSKLCGVLGEVLLKVKSPYRSFYDNYKQRWISAGKGTSDIHRHKAAIRYMIKMLLNDIHKEWRKFEGLPVRPSYQEQYLGHTHHSSSPLVAEFDPQAIEINDELKDLDLDDGTADA